MTDSTAEPREQLRHEPTPEPPPEALQKAQEEDASLEQEAGKAQDSPPPVVVKREQPLLKLLKWTAVTVVGLVVSLFLLGLALGFMGVRPPTFAPGGVVPAGEDPTASTSSAAPSEPSSGGDAREAGRRAGELFKEHRDAPEAFWEGFQEGSGQ